MEADGLEALETSMGDSPNGTFEGEPPIIIKKPSVPWNDEEDYRKETVRQIEELEEVIDDEIPKEIKQIIHKNLGKINFGKFAGERWQTLPRTYLLFIIEKSNTSQENKNKAKEVLDYYDSIQHHANILEEEYGIDANEM